MGKTRLAMKIFLDSFQSRKCYVKFSAGIWVWKLRARTRIKMKLP